MEKCSEKPKKKGKTCKLVDGSLGLMNDKGEAYRVTPKLLKFWHLCNGSKTNHDLTEAIKRPEDVVEEVEKKIPQITIRLKQADLLE
ncbi:MAG: hypothetical protein ABIH76_08085 [Candidatus Bathyarchaeota archaeon]